MISSSRCDRSRGRGRSRQSRDGGRRRRPGAGGGGGSGWNGAGRGEGHATRCGPWRGALGAASEPLLLVLLVLLLTPPVGSAQADAGPGSGAAEIEMGAAEDVGLLRGLGRYREWLERWGLELELVYMGDYLVNTRGGIDQDDSFLGNLDMTLTWQTEPMLGRDLGTFFFYGLYDHGDRPSDDVGDLQIVDNIEAPDAARLYEAWWQKTFFDDRASLLLGLYDLNSEFYVVESALVFLHSSFGIGAALGNSGRNGPSIFPEASLAARLKVVLGHGWELQAAVLDGVPGDPDRSPGTRIRFGEDDGVLAIAEVAHAWRPIHEAAGESVSRAPRRRAIGRAIEAHPYALRVAAGSWVYSARRDHLSQTVVDGSPERERGHPGFYATADLDVRVLDPFGSRGLAVFLQLGWADEDIEPFEAYVGGGITYTGLLPWRPEDVLGVAVAAAFGGNGLQGSIRANGGRPASAETAIEWTYRARIRSWLAIQGDLQYIVDPGVRRDRPDALVAGLRFIVSL